MSEWWLEPPFVLRELHHAHVDDLLDALDHDVLALLATTFPCAYELTAQIIPRSYGAGRHDARTSDTSFAAADCDPDYGWHHGAKQGCEESA